MGNEEKLLKGNLKRKMKLTLATVVGFLITGTLSFAEEITTIINDGTMEIINLNGNPYKQGSNIINNGSIVGGLYGIYSSSSSSSSSIGAIENSGSIVGRADGISSSSFFSSSSIGAITNSGSIVGGTYGIYSFSSSSLSSSSIGAIENSGSIVGGLDGISSSSSLFSSSSSSSIGAIENSGSIVGRLTGIESNGKITSEIASVNNGGVIVGKESQAIKGDVTEAYNNYGILAGKTASSPKNNYGLNITLNDDGTVAKIDRENVGTSGVTFDGKTIVNATVSGTSTDTIVVTENKNNTIYNGVDKTIAIKDDNVTISNSIINGYESAVSLEGTGKLTLNGTTVNGGGKDVTDANVSLGIAIEGDATDNNLEINNGIINGVINLGAGNDKLIIAGEDSRVNGELQGGAGDDTLILGSETIVRDNTDKKGINIFHNIDGFENTEINGKVTLFENIKITGMDNLVINKDGELNLRVDPTKKVDGSENIKAGALYDSGVAISGDGTLNIVSAGLTDGNKVDFGKDTSITENTKVGLDSILITGKLEEKVIIIVKNNNIELSDNVARHDKLNDIYTQINGENLKDINTIITTAEKDKNKQVEMLSSYLASVYGKNPYSLSSEFSRKSAELMRNSILANREKAIKNEQITYGGLTHQDGRLDGSYYGPDLNGITRYSGDIDVDTNLFGAYGAIEYGYFDKTSLGFVVGGSRGDSKVGSSKVDGNIIYTGIYSKTDLPYNLRLTVGTGVQHGSYDAERNYLSDNHKGNYSDTAFDIYANIKYTQMLQENLFLDYGFGMSYTYVDQDSISEENKNLAIDVDSKTFDYTDAKLDLGLRKVIGNNFGKHNLKLGASYSYMLDGADEENLRGNFKGTNSFDILVAEKEKDTFGVSLGYELERENGFMLNVNAGYNFSDSDNDEMVVGVQIGKKL